MREYAIPFVKGLKQGLRAFPSPPNGGEMLIECYNLSPTELGLRGHEPLLPLGISAPFIEYFAIRDSNDVVWYWMANGDLTTLFSTEVPDVTSLGFAEVHSALPMVVPYWLQVDAADAPAVQLFIFPAPFSGDLIVSDDHPALVPGHDGGAGLILRSFSGWKHKLSALTSLDHFWQQLGD